MQATSIAAPSSPRTVAEAAGAARPPNDAAEPSETTGGFARTLETAQDVRSRADSGPPRGDAGTADEPTNQTDAAPAEPDASPEVDLADPAPADAQEHAAQAAVASGLVAGAAVAPTAEGAAGSGSGAAPPDGVGDESSAPLRGAGGHGQTNGTSVATGATHADGDGTAASDAPGATLRPSLASAPRMSTATGEAGNSGGEEELAANAARTRGAAEGAVDGPDGSQTSVAVAEPGIGTAEGAPRGAAESPVVSAVAAATPARPEGRRPAQRDGEAIAGRRPDVGERVPVAPEPPAERGAARTESPVAPVLDTAAVAEASADRPVEPASRAAEAGLRLVDALGRAAEAPAGGARTGEAAADRIRPEALQAVATRGLGAALRQQGGTVTLRLEPHSLGQLRIQMSLDGARVAVQIETGSAEVRDALTVQLGALRSALESRGLQVDRLHAAIAPELGGSLSESGAAPARPHPERDGAGQRERGGEPQREHHPPAGERAEAQDDEDAFESLLHLSVDTTI